MHAPLSISTLSLYDDVMLKYGRVTYYCDGADMVQEFSQMSEYLDLVRGQRVCKLLTLKLSRFLTKATSSLLTGTVDRSHFAFDIELWFRFNYRFLD